MRKLLDLPNELTKQVYSFLGPALKSEDAAVMMILYHADPLFEAGGFAYEMQHIWFGYDRHKWTLAAFRSVLSLVRGEFTFFEDSCQRPLHLKTYITQMRDALIRGAWRVFERLIEDCTARSVISKGNGDMMQLFSLACVLKNTKIPAIILRHFSAVPHELPSDHTSRMWCSRLYPQDETQPYYYSGCMGWMIAKNFRHDLIHLLGPTRPFDVVNYIRFVSKRAFPTTELYALEIKTVLDTLHEPIHESVNSMLGMLMVHGSENPFWFVAMAHFGFLPPATWLDEALIKKVVPHHDSIFWYDEYVGFDIHPLLRPLHSVYTQEQIILLLEHEWKRDYRDAKAMPLDHGEAKINAICYIATRCIQGDTSIWALFLAKYMPLILDNYATVCCVFTDTSKEASPRSLVEVYEKWAATE